MTSERGRLLTYLSFKMSYSSKKILEISEYNFNERVSNMATMSTCGQKYRCLFFSACSAKWKFLGNVMCAFCKKLELVIWDLRSFLFLSLLKALQFSILPLIYRSQITNPHFLQNACMMSCKYCQHAKKCAFILLRFISVLDDYRNNKKVFCQNFS